MTERVFPSEFAWGAATAAYQIEGAVHEDGRGESIWDRFSAMPGKIRNNDTGAAACDHYHRYSEDIALMRRLNLNAYRFSVAWPRILPAGTGKVNQAGLDFYDRLVDDLLAAGLSPFVTLYHWDLPQALEDTGGWPARDTAEAFAAYADIVSRRIGDRVRHWITHNEPWVASWLGYGYGSHAPGIASRRAALQAAHHLLLSHGLALPALQANSPGSEVGMTLSLTPAEAASASAADQAAARRFDGYNNRWFLDPLTRAAYPEDLLEYYAADAPIIGPNDLATIATPIDFMGVNFYFRAIVKHDLAGDQVETRLLRVDGEYTEMGWEVCPEALGRLLMRLHTEYNIPRLYLTENGAAYTDPQPINGTVNDESRRRYLERHLIRCHDAIAAGVPLAGYFVWSLLDNFEWAFGYSKRFGIIYVDYETQQRTIKASGHWYSEVAARGGIAEC